MNAKLHTREYLWYVEMLCSETTGLWKKLKIIYMNIINIKCNLQPLQPWVR